MALVRHEAAAPVGQLQNCRRCGISLVDVAAGRVTPEGQSAKAPFWEEAQFVYKDVAFVGNVPPPRTKAAECLP